jgi:glutamyl-tRNA synthetase
VDQWLEYAGSLAPGSALEAACAVANEYLQLRTYLVGYRLSLADLACWGQLAGAALG